jgi:hypothetical protein
MTTITSVSTALPALSVVPRSVRWLSRLRATRGYDVTMSVLGSVWFLVLALAVGFDVFGQARSMSAGDLSATGLSSLLATVCLFLFYLTLWWVMLVRSSPAARIDRLVPSIIAFAGGYLPWAVVLIAPSNASESLNLASTALLLIGNVLMVIVVRQLGRSFSVVPQARRLVRTGPYAII